MFRTFLAATLLFSLAPFTAAQGELLPNWIWHEHDARVVFQRVFEVAPELERATLTVSCDDGFELRVNGGEVLASANDWRSPVVVELAGELVPGANRIALLARNDSSHAGLVAWLALEYADGARAELVTDAAWLATAEVTDDWGVAPLDESAWSAVRIVGPLGCWPWHQVVAPRPAGGEARALAAEELELPTGFHAQLLYSVPKEQEGSWVALCEDDRGRLYVSDQSAGLYRLTVPPFGTNGDVQVERVAVELGGAQGLEWVDGILYVVVNADGGKSGLYRLTDSDGDDALDTVELLRALDGSGEHGPHAVRRSPDGDGLYVIAGNHTKLPEGVEERRWDEDQLLPREPDPGGHAVGVLAPGGWLCWTDFDGATWELVAWGMRNAYDFDFAWHGNVLTYDSDMEWDVGAPWYRPTRVLQLVLDADFGWRNGSGKWPVEYPDTLPSVVDIGVGSPTGVVSGERARFPEQWRGALFVLDWSYGTIYAVHAHSSSREGQTLAGRVEPFVRGKPLPVTDVVIASDGSMLFTTGGRGAQSGLYRVTWLGDGLEVDDHLAHRVEDPELERKIERFLEQQGDRILEQQGAPTRRRPARAAALRELTEEQIVELMWPALGDDDRFDRHTARTILEDQGFDAWRVRLERERDPRVVIEACVALARVGDADDLPLLLAKLGELPLADLDDATTIGMLRALGLGFMRLRAPDEAERALVVARLDPLFPTGRTAVDRELARMLVYLEAPALVPRVLAAMQAAPSHQEGLHHAFFLRELPEGWTLAERRTFFDYLDAAQAAGQGGHSLGKYLDGLRADVWDAMDDEQRARVDPWRASKLTPDWPKLELAGRESTRWTIDALMPAEGELASGRSFDTGRRAFASASCYTCHRIAGQGGGSGPDLTGAGARFGARDLLEALIEPSKVVSDQYRDTEVLLTDDALMVGRLLDESDEWIALLTLPPEEAEYEVPRADIASIRPHPLSRMPEALLDPLTREEVLDLLAFLIAGGDPDDAAFGE